nr:MAG TPA: hypothetical protein [Caudoviricetes sp.]
MGVAIQKLVWCNHLHRQTAHNALHTSHGVEP